MNIRLGFAIGAGLIATTGAIYFSRPSASAQTPQNQPPPVFRTEANYIRVDVYPTRDDAPVTDLTQNDFEILDNGVPQKIDQFERVVVRAAGPQDARIEPNNVRESLAMAESSRARLFVLFLDTYHVDIFGSNAIRKPLIDALDRMIGADDLVAVMTPAMSARDVTFARKTTTIEEFLTRYWYWGGRDQNGALDQDDRDYGMCYPNVPKGTDCDDQNGVAAQMIDRRHEKLSLDALHDLVGVLHGLREERKAIVAVTAGWLRYPPDRTLMRPLACHATAGIPRINVDPRSGRPTTREVQPGASPENKCEADRMRLAQIDDDRDFHELLDEANRANASFYPIDPRGLAVFDTPLMRTDVPGSPPPMTPPAVDSAMLRGRLESLRTLAEATDGLAAVNSNDLARSMKRIVDDLSSYYLLGYYASGKLDGKFHSITVRVKRPGVRVRARRGYLAASAAELTRTTPQPAATPAPSAAALSDARAITAAIAPLENDARPIDLRMRATAGWKPGNTAAIWLVGELASAPQWSTGADADLSLTTDNGDPLTSARAHVDPGFHSFRIVLSPRQPLAAGDYIVRVRARSVDGTASTTETLRVVLPNGPEATGAVFMRRGPSTGNRDVPTSDLRFRRSEQIRIEVPTPAAAIVSARLLDRTGKALNVPVAASVRDDADGSRWQIAQVTLAPLAPADYVIEITESAGAAEPGGASPATKRSLVGFRVVP